MVQCRGGSSQAHVARSSPRPMIFEAPLQLLKGFELRVVHTPESNGASTGSTPPSGSLGSVWLCQWPAARECIVWFFSLSSRHRSGRTRATRVVTGKSRRASRGYSKAPSCPSGAQGHCSAAPTSRRLHGKTALCGRSRCTGAGGLLDWLSDRYGTRGSLGALNFE
jgi:hypothetical protein